MRVIVCNNSRKIRESEKNATRDCFSVASCCLFCSGCVTLSSAEDKIQLPGDADGNGKVDVWDVRSISRSLKAKNLRVPCPQNTDVTQNGMVDEGDLQAIDDQVHGISTIKVELDYATDPIPIGTTVVIRASDAFLPLNVKGGTVRIRSEAAAFDSLEQPLSPAKDGRSVYYHWSTFGLPPAHDYQITVTLSKDIPCPKPA